MIQKNFSLYSEKLVLKKIPGHGKGIFTKKNIKEGEIVIVYGGYVMTSEQHKRLPKSLEYFSFHIEDNILIGIRSKKQLSLGEYINHSCNPSCGFRDQLLLVAIKDIQKGEEITTDYAFFVTSNTLTMKCSCGARNCRGIIKNTDWKIPALQRKYKKYFQSYIQKKIARVKNKK